MALGFAFLTIVGEDNFDLVVENLKNVLAATPSSGSPSPPAPLPPKV